jgi:hypothetical protein
VEIIHNLIQNLTGTLVISDETGTKVYKGRKDFVELTGKGTNYSGYS